MTSQPPSQSEKPADADLSGRQLGDYRLLRRLGRGAMAEVYLAEQASLRRQVAIKVLKRDLASDANYIRRFQLEAQAAAALVHANIVQIHEVGCVDGIHYIAQEYVPGRNLNEYLARFGPPGAKRAVSMIRQMAAALAKAADQGIVHRDIKPENIMLGAGGELKVADFGLARAAGDGNGLNLTQIGMTMGTPLYMSPEQVEGKPLDPRSDIYSLGVTCYHLLAGQPPFAGDTPLAVALQHLKGTPDPLTSLRPDLPVELCRTVHRMLAKQPEDRQPSARDVLRELRALALDEPDEAWPELAPGEESPESPRYGARHQATQQLEAVMHRERRLRRQSAQLARWLALPALAFLLGGVAAWGLRDRSLLAGADAGRSHVSRRDSALDQYLYAATINTEEAWLSLRQYFPREQYYVDRADQQLARLYLYKDDYEQALKLFRRFAAMGDSEIGFRAFGLAGECAIYSLQGDYARSSRVLAELYPLRAHLDGQMRDLVELAVTRNHRAGGSQTSQEWRAWLEAKEEIGS
ncbi:MAG: serine/threonine protein kinase [Planctomycetaceae bacterium]|nr:serine/threonine protein kinase [Planctomycetaceae bacterium]